MFEFLIDTLEKETELNREKVRYTQEIKTFICFVLVKIEEFEERLDNIEKNRKMSTNNSKKK